MMTTKPTRTKLPISGRIVLADSQLVLEGAPQFSLPDTLDDLFVSALLSYQPGDYRFIAELATEVDFSERQRLRQYVKTSSNQSLRVQYFTAAASYAALLKENGRWEEHDFTAIYRSDLGRYCGVIDNVIVTKDGLRFIKLSDSRIVSLPEFQFIFGESAVDYLGKMRGQAETHFEQALFVLTAPIEDRTILVVDRSSTLQTISLKGLVGVPSHKLLLPIGLTYVADETVDR